ncbi:GNAT family N-acetyltransferase [Roseovarius faecimaris]|uniref:GNAT family N-acetyltransferase n=2 Tax=Roseovarius faecimaris TaxID=2494550 RepID=A0A6I6IQL6_9RHOB|nr:GNAT family N-acetyltransferase [Roseovarius faecimaris]QGX98995.1 GNAT family N-acetyltransferase [Roseovarius faecimaris]
MDKITIRDFTADDAPWIAETHGALYRRGEGFDETFQPLVASILEDFITRSDPDRERGWIAERGGARVGCIFCTRLDDKTAKLRLFLVLPDLRGSGLGQKLLNECMSFAQSHGYEGMQLWTHESHRAACALYRRNGWQLRASKPVHSFGCDLVEQSWTYSFEL